jgi:hypothetical protein
MGNELVARRRVEMGSVAWLERTGGHLNIGERIALMLQGVGALAEGIRLALRVRRDERRRILFSSLEPPDTPMVNAARHHLEAHSCQELVNHGYRMGYWTMAILHQHGALTPAVAETTWVAALLHDIGLEDPPAGADCTLRGVRVVQALAREHGWNEEQTTQASEAIATNPNARVDSRRFGIVAWAMKVGAMGEHGFPPHRAQMHPEWIAELEGRYRRDRFRETGLRLVAEEARRMPDGRFALVQRLLPLIFR